MILAAEEQASMAAEGGGAPPAGMPPAMPSPVASVQGDATSIEGLMQEAEQMAQQILVMPGPQRRSALIELKKNNETLHAQVKSILDSYDNQAAQQGKAAMAAGEMPPQPVSG
jgi:hypothetical protein